MKYQVTFALIVGLLSSEARAVFEVEFLKHHRGFATAGKNLVVRSENIASQHSDGYKVRYLASQHRILSLSGVGFFEIPQPDGALAYARTYGLGADFNETTVHSFSLNEAGNVVARILDQNTEKQKILPIRVVRITNPNAMTWHDDGLFKKTLECGEVCDCSNNDVHIELVDVYEELRELEKITRKWMRNSGKSGGI